MELNISKYNEANNALQDLFFQMRKAIKCENLVHLEDKEEKIEELAKNVDLLIDTLDGDYMYLLLDLIDSIHAFRELSITRHNIQHIMSPSNKSKIELQIKNVTLLQSILYTKQKEFYRRMNGHYLTKVNFLTNFSKN